MIEKLSPEILQRIRRIRKDKSMSQQEMADKIGISRTYYVQVEKGKKTPSSPILLGIIKALGVSKKEILGD